MLADGLRAKFSPYDSMKDFCLEPSMGLRVVEAAGTITAEIISCGRLLLAAGLGLSLVHMIAWKFAALDFRWTCVWVKYLYES